MWTRTSTLLGEGWNRNINHMNSNSTSSSSNNSTNNNNNNNQQQQVALNESYSSLEIPTTITNTTTNVSQQQQHEVEHSSSSILNNSSSSNYQQRHGKYSQNSSTRLQRNHTTQNTKSNHHHHPHPPKIRQRPISFGNPALGTYHGIVYTIEEVQETTATSSTNPKRNNQYLYNDFNNNNNNQKRPIIENGIAVHNIAAMVNVPPNQVPDGIVHIALPYRPYICHVRIVIADVVSSSTAITTTTTSTTTTTTTTSITATGASVKDTTIKDNEDYDRTKEDDTPQLDEGEEKYYEDLSTLILDANNSNISIKKKVVSLSSSSMYNMEAIENAAAIIANEEHQEQPFTSTADNDVKDNNEGLHPSDDRRTTTNIKTTTTERTYVVLFELDCEESVDMFVTDLHNQPYNYLDDSITCQVYPVIAIQGIDNVSVMSPFFAPMQQQQQQQQQQQHPPTSSSSLLATSNDSNLSTDNTSDITASNNNKITEDYNCAVCLEGMEVSSSLSSSNISSTQQPTHVGNDNIIGSQKAILTTVCNHTFHFDCLVQWQDSPCPVCRYDHSGLNDDALLSQCHICSTTHNNYVCLICGIVSCGGWTGGMDDSTTSRNGDSLSSSLTVPWMNTVEPTAGNDSCRSADTYRDNTVQRQQPHRILPNSHARKHYDETLHAYALCTETQHVWDFAGQGYVHRLLQNKDDGKLVEVHDPMNTTSQERSLSPGLTQAQEGEVVHRKLESFASQYYTLLKSQLEQQRIYYESRLEEIRREYSTSVPKQKPKRRVDTGADLISVLKQERQQLTQRLQSIKGKCHKVTGDVTFIKSLNESLEANREPLRQQLEEAQRERAEIRKMFNEALPPLQEKVTKLMLQLESTNFNNENN